jgi:hypothetical protein
MQEQINSTRDMDVRQISEILAEAFANKFGEARPEFVSRFEPILMLAIDEPAFKHMLRNSLKALGSRSGFINANLRLVGFDDAAATLLYEQTEVVCEFNEKTLKRSLNIGLTR